MFYKTFREIFRNSKVIKTMSGIMPKKNNLLATWVFYVNVQTAGFWQILIFCVGSKKNSESIFFLKSIF